MPDLALVVVCAAGLLGQSALLCRIAGLEGRAAGLAVAASAAAAALAAAAWRRLGPHPRMAVAMLALGGLGMTGGWWLDLGAGAPCHPGASGAQLHLLSWMNAGMLVLGLPAMALASREGSHPGVLLLSAPLMVFGMLAGSLAAGLGSGALALGPGGARLLDWAAMNLGMLASMLPAHAFGHRGAPHARRASEP